MKMSTRRDLLAGVIGASMMHVPNSFGLPAVTNRQLDIFFHGFFVFQIKKNGITAYAPVVPTHSYGAGEWLNEEPILKGQTIQIAAFSHSPFTPASPDSNKDAVLDSTKWHGTQINGDACFFSFSCPLPKAIQRYRISSNGVKPILKGDTATAGGITLHSVPLLYRFSYPITDSSVKLNNRLDVDTWDREISINRRLSLHVTAEPLYTGNTHLDMAFDALCSMFSPALIISPEAPTLGASVAPPIQDSALDPREQWTLREEHLNHPQTPNGRGANIRNCFSMWVK